MCKIMSMSLLARRALVCLCLAAAAPVVVQGQTNYVTNGFEYPIAGNDDAIRSIRVILQKLVQAMLEGRGTAVKSAPADLAAVSE